MTPSVENAIRAVARKCRVEIKKAVRGLPRALHDSVITSILDKYAAEITCLPPDTFSAKRWLSYYIRQIDQEQNRKCK